MLAAAAPAAARGLDGISDQSLPAWDGGFAASPLAGALAPALQGPERQFTLARYVVQWNAAAEPSAGPSAAGDYRERLEAWLADVGAARLTPVLALTSYDGSYPGSAGQYAAALSALLAAAFAAGHPIPYVEAWNEPNNQGREPPRSAALLADAAQGVCRLYACTVIAGDFEDGAGLAPYEQAYVAALTFAPRIWGVHPYADLAQRSEQPLARFRAGLPDAGAGAQLWFTETASFYCLRGRVLGEAAQAAQAAFLRSLLASGPLAPEHAFYYGLEFADRLSAPCKPGGGDDSELYAPGDRPRAAAPLLISGAGPLALFGPQPQA